MRATLGNRVLRRFALSQFLLEVQFWFPVWLIFLTDRGFSLTTAVLADGVFRLTVVAFEFPLGVVADRVGRRRSYLAVSVLSVATFVAVAGVRATWNLFGAWVLWGILWALTSGAGSAYLYELCRHEGMERDTLRVFGVLRAVTSSAVLMSHLAAGLLYSIDPAAPFIATAVLAAGAFLVSLRLPETLPAIGLRRDLVSLRNQASQIRSALAGRAVRSAFALLVMLFVFGWSARILYQPLILHLGLSATTAGAMYFGYSAMAVIAGFYAGMGSGRRRTRVAVGAAALWLGVAATAVFPKIAPVVFVPLTGFGYYLGWTVLEVLLNERILADRVRATLISAVGFVGGLAIAAARPLLGRVADVASAPAAFGMWAVVGAGFLAVGAVIVQRVGARRSL